MQLQRLTLRLALLANARALLQELREKPSAVGFSEREGIGKGSDFYVSTIPTQPLQFSPKLRLVVRFALTQFGIPLSLPIPVLNSQVHPL